MRRAGRVEVDRVLGHDAQRLTGGAAGGYAWVMSRRGGRGTEQNPSEPRAADTRVLRMRVGDAELAVVSTFVARPGSLPDLTAAEQDVLTRLLAGESNAQIAAARRTSTRTVGNQVASLFQKIGVSSRSELAALWSK